LDQLNSLGRRVPVAEEREDLMGTRRCGRFSTPEKEGTREPQRGKTHGERGWKKSRAHQATGKWHIRKKHRKPPSQSKKRG